MNNPPGADLGIEDPQTPVKASWLDVSTLLMVAGVGFYYWDLSTDIAVVVSLAPNATAQNVTATAFDFCLGNASAGTVPVLGKSSPSPFLFWTALVFLFVAPLYVAFSQDTFWSERFMTITTLRLPYEVYLSLETGVRTKALFALTTAEVVLEAIPQTTLQQYILLPILLNDGATMAEVSLLLISVSISIATMANTFYGAFDQNRVNKMESDIMYSLFYRGSLVLFHLSVLLFRFLPMMSLAATRGGKFYVPSRVEV